MSMIPLCLPCLKRFGGESSSGRRKLRRRNRKTQVHLGVSQLELQGLFFREIP